MASITVLQQTVQAMYAQYPKGDFSIPLTEFHLSDEEIAQVLNELCTRLEMTWYKTSTGVYAFSRTSVSQPDITMRRLKDQTLKYFHEKLDSATKGCMALGNPAQIPKETFLAVLDEYNGPQSEYVWKMSGKFQNGDDCVTLVPR